MALTEVFWRRSQQAKAVELALAALTSLGHVVEGGDLSRNTTAPAGSGSGGGGAVVVRRWGLVTREVLD